MRTIHAKTKSKLRQRDQIIADLRSQLDRAQDQLAERDTVSLRPPPEIDNPWSDSDHIIHESFT